MGRNTALRCNYIIIVKYPSDLPSHKPPSFFTSHKKVTKKRKKQNEKQMLNGKNRGGGINPQYV